MKCHDADAQSLRDLPLVAPLRPKRGSLVKLGRDLRRSVALFLPGHLFPLPEAPLQVSVDATEPNYDPRRVSRRDSDIQHRNALFIPRTYPDTVKL